MAHNRSLADKRRYIRISTVLPVEFSLTDVHCRRVSSYIQGFTNNISKAGICLNVNDFSGEYDKTLLLGNTVVLTLTLPFLRTSLTMVGRITWKDKESAAQYHRLKLGVEFTDIKKKEAQVIFGYALFKKVLPYSTLSVLLLISLISLQLYFKEQELIKRNIQTVQQYKALVVEVDNLRSTVDREDKHVDDVRKRYQALAVRLNEREQELAQWKGQLTKLQSEKNRDIPQEQRLAASVQSAQKEIQTLRQEKDFLNTVLTERLKAQKVLRRVIQAKEKERSAVSSTIAQGMHTWIRSRQQPKTGLLVSYEGDHQLSGVAFTYDQALACMVFLINGETGRARHILDFYREQLQKNNPIYNAYYAVDGAPNEYVQHSGVYAWIGLAALQYVQKTNDRSYLIIAEKVAEFLEKMMDEDGGIVGGPSLTWYATEHNLDAYAFYMLFNRIREDTHYAALSDKLAVWLSQFAYSRREVPVQRGKGDATIATDTYAWSITALGPAVLVSLGMNPDKIMDFAIENCEVETTFFRKAGSIKVKGFDFAKFVNIARGGVISCEWTAQMILSMQIMAEYYADQDPAAYREYLRKVILYSSELQKMIINSPTLTGKSYPALPYASDAQADTGHGWRTPNGNENSALASTAYFLFAYEGWNPLQAKPLRLSLKSILEKESEAYYQQISE